MGLQKNLFLGGSTLCDWDRLYMMYPGHYKQNPATFKRWFGFVKDTNIFWATEEVVMGQNLWCILMHNIFGWTSTCTNRFGGIKDTRVEWQQKKYSDLLGTWCRIATWGTRPGKRLQFANWKDPPFFMGTSTISMAIFNSKLLVYQRVFPINITIFCCWVVINYFDWAIFNSKMLVYQAGYVGILDLSAVPHHDFSSRHGFHWILFRTAVL
jgi:hypothetical protein